MEALTKQEVNDLVKHERTIQQTQGAFVACGMALKAIQDGKLYRNTHKTFESYCLEKWGWKKSRAYQLIEGAQVVKKLPHSLSTIVDKEAKAREIAPLSTEDAKKVLGKAKASGDTSTKGIRKAKKELAEQSIDQTGFPIPEPIVPSWDQALTIGHELTKLVSDARTSFEKYLDNPIVSEVNSSAVIANLKNAYNDLKRIIPYAVCTSCQGRPKKCGLCKNRGFISKFAWDTIVPEESKKIRTAI